MKQIKEQSVDAKILAIGHGDREAGSKISSRRVKIEWLESSLGSSNCSRRIEICCG
jgi:hypothetical protein